VRHGSSRRRGLEAVVSRIAKSRPVEITARLTREISRRLADSKSVRRQLPEWGRVHIDRSLPFLCVYRRPTYRSDEGTDRLVSTEASYLTISGARRHHASLQNLVETIAETLSRQFGAFLVLEIWSELDAASPPSPEEPPVPRFRILAPKNEEIGTFVPAFSRALSQISWDRQPANVRVDWVQSAHPPRLAPIISAQTAHRIGCLMVGLEVNPFFRDTSIGQVYPAQLSVLSRKLSRALRHVFFDFTRTRTSHRPRHYHMLGRRAMVKAVWQVDRQLADIADQFDLLLLATPVNAQQAWHEFQRLHYEQAPRFRYRSVSVDPALLKRLLYATPIERVEDPALALLFRQKQDELDRQITMISDLNTSRFLHGSLQLYGGVNDRLLTGSLEILRSLPPRTRDDSGSGYLDAEGFARRAAEEIAHYRKMWPEVAARATVREDVNSGLMVSQGSLLIGKRSRIPMARVEALLQHEIGTHILTYYNGRAQPFRQLYAGLAGYEALQEGVAVLAEYLVGGLSRPRLRLLAARVAAARSLIDGASFVECYRDLTGTYRLARHAAFSVTMRVHRGGGLTKDAIYLRGLNQLLSYLRNDGRLEPLFIGKIAIDHVPIIEELRWREILRAPPLIPRYMSRPGVADRLERVRHCESALHLIERNKQ
jgi:uncharacterized protein (TIGR02421 family)